MRQTKKATKSLKIDTNGLKIKVKKKDSIIVNIKDIIFLLQVFHILSQILVFWQPQAINYNYS